MTEGFGLPNVLTLSCKSRLTCRPPWGGAAAAATNTHWRERTAADVTPACSSEPPEGGSAAEPRLGGFCQLVRAVRQPGGSQTFLRLRTQLMKSSPSRSAIWKPRFAAALCATG